MDWKTTIRACAAQNGLDLAAVASVDSLAAGPDVGFYQSWVAEGRHAGLGYLEDHRAEIRADLHRLLPGARSVICVALNYNAPLPYSTTLTDTSRAWISRYAWGEDYHDGFRAKVEAFVTELRACIPEAFEARVCVDTAPVLERALARHAGVGWTGKNTCMINQQLGSWLFLGEVLLTLELDPDAPAADRCGSCTCCIDACPTDALVEPRLLDSRRCIAYWTIEEKGAIAPEMRAGIGRQVFGCDICQDVCPWNRKAAVTQEFAFQPRLFNPPLEELASITEEQFHEMFRNSPVRRAKYRGLMRNVCVAMGNSGDAKFIPELQRLAAHHDALIREHAEWGLERLTTPGMPAK